MTVTSPLLSRRAARAMTALPLIGLLAACEQPLDYDLRGQIGAFNTTEAAKTATADRPAPDNRGLITYPSYQVAVARRGDTVGDVAARIGLPAADLARYNGMEPADPIREGAVLALPRRAPAAAPGTGKAAPGGVDIAALAGQAIETAPAASLPASPNPGSVTTTKIQPVAQPAKPKVQDGPEPVRHKVTRGETAYTISRLYQVPVKSLAEWNGLGSDFAVREGQYLLIPVVDQPAPPREQTEVTAPGAGSATPPPPSAAKPLPQEEVAPATAAVATPPAVKVPEPTRKSDAALDYPVQGKIIATYAKGSNDGIKIKAAPGTPVKAADGGTVLAVTQDADKVPIIVIRHNPRLLTVYANVDNITVKKGDSVSRGQAIATLGSGDNAHLHFEVRDGYESTNPLPYLN